MKQMMNKWLPVLILMAAIGFACEKEEEPTNDCYTCTGCTGQYAHLLNDREYCVDGFDNKSDWEANKTNQEEDSGCTCE